MRNGWNMLWPHAVRLVVGGIFMYAGAIKIVDVPGFAKNIHNYQMLSDLGVNAAAIFLPWLEVFTGAALILVPRLRRAAALWILLMLAVFTVAVVVVRQAASTSVVLLAVARQAVARPNPYHLRYPDLALVVITLRLRPAVVAVARSSTSARSTPWPLTMKT